MIIDWWSCRIQIEHTRIDGGRLLKLGPGGVLEWESVQGDTLEHASHDARVLVRTIDADGIDGPGRELYISGSPLKWLQGHNVTGSDEHAALFLAWSRDLLARLGLVASDQQLLAAVVTRCDVTESWELPTRADVLAWIRAAEQAATIRQRGRGVLRGDTLYFGKQSRRWSLKIYSKVQELQAHKPSCLCIGTPQHVVAYAERLLRIELVLRSLELRKLGIMSVADMSAKAETVYRAKLAHLHLGDQRVLARTRARAADTLKPRHRLALDSWAAGVDLEGTLPRASYYRLRRELLELVGVDLRACPVQAGSVVPLLRPLEATPAASRPDLCYLPRVAA